MWAPVGFNTGASVSAGFAGVQTESKKSQWYLADKEVGHED
jgi:hypothetical protein